MLRGELIKQLKTILKFEQNVLYKSIIEFFIKCFDVFEVEYVYELKNYDKIISIVIDNHGKFLFIDLSYTDLNIRYMHTEFYFFIKEMAFFDLIFILDNFIKGKYIFETFLNKDRIVKQNLIFDNPNLVQHNQIDLYSSFFTLWKNNKSIEVISSVGHNWLTGQSSQIEPILL